MVLLSDQKYAVERAIISDVLSYSGARLVVDDARACVVKCGEWHKCVFADIGDFYRYAEKFGLFGKVCLLGAPPDAPTLLGFSASPCRSYAYLKPMPPLPHLPHGVEIKRLAPSLAETVAAEYGGGYSTDEMREVMRGLGVFGAIKDGGLAGFIGRHGDGSMGMLKVFDEYRRKGLAFALESFLITYVMTFARVPFCDVYTDNAPSMALQDKLGLTGSGGFTFWCDIVEK